MAHKTIEELDLIAKKELEKIQGKELTNKDRMAIPQMEMPSREPKERSRQMSEVALGYTETQAVVEASRCLQCKNMPCIAGCPVGVKIPQFIAKIAEKDFKGAVDTIKETSLLPAICGRVCPQEKVTMPEIAKKTGKKVAVIGAGPAGLTVAADCARAGHQVTVFEAFHKAGGVMMYGIPEFRLPKAIVQNEIDNLKKMGVEFDFNFLVGRTNTLDQLLEEKNFDAAFVGTGAGLPKFMKIPGENLIGVFSANEYLTRANLMKGYDKEHAATPIYDAKHVVVCGAGNVAMDAARMAFRLGAEEVDIVYRRTRAEMPARLEEIAHAEEEGVNFRFLENPVEVLGNEEGKVCGVKVLSYELGEPDASGRRSPVPIPGSEHEIPCDAMIVALGNGSNPLLVKTTPGLNQDSKGHISVDEKQLTSKAKVWAGGDIVLGAATVILAMGEGRKAASAINEYLAK